MRFDWWVRLSARDPRIAPNRNCSPARIVKPSVAPLLGLGCQMFNFIAGLHRFPIVASSMLTHIVATVCWESKI